MTTQYEIWVEGYAATGDKAEARFVGLGHGSTFEDAVMAHYLEHPDSAFNPATLQYWGCQHFSSEQEARAAFG